MSHLSPLAINEHCRVQVLSAPAEPNRAVPEHVTVFIEARDAATVSREIRRLGGARGVVRAVFAEPVETPRETFVSHGFMCADNELPCTCSEKKSPPRNFLRWGLPSSLMKSSS